MPSNILDFFPKNDTPRPSQVEILEKVFEAIKEKVKFIIIQAPTGSGKSHLAATLANYSRDYEKHYLSLVQTGKIFKKYPGGDYVHKEILQDLPRAGCVTLTETKALQNQYKDLFSNARILKGKQNYPCAIDEEFDCDLGPCLISRKLKESCQQKNCCPYDVARIDTLASKLSVLNYSVFLTLPTHVKYRQFIICDEASELEDEIVNSFSCTIEYSKIDLKGFDMKKIYSDDVNLGHNWLLALAEHLKEEVDELQSVILNTKRDNEGKKKLIFKMRFYKNMLEKIILILKNWFKTEYIIEFDSEKCSFTPLYVNMLAQDFFQFGETIILMSGTILDHKTYAKTLGITEYKFIEVDSEFDPKKSPIYCWDKCVLNHENMDKNLPKVVDAALKICEHHQNQSGIIHTHTFKITRAIQDKIKGQRRFLFREEGITNEMLLQQHFERTDETVLISPSLGFGTDLYGEFGRFQIIIKTPYLPLGSKRIGILAKRNPRWYETRALIKLVQMCGRTTRSIDDYSDTYILDGQAINLIKRNNIHLPKWFVSRLH